MSNIYCNNNSVSNKKFNSYVCSVQNFKKKVFKLRIFAVIFNNIRDLIKSDNGNTALVGYDTGKTAGQYLLDDAA